MSKADVALDITRDHLRAALNSLGLLFEHIEDNEQVELAVGYLGFNIQLVLSDVEKIRSMFNGKS